MSKVALKDETAVDKETDAYLRSQAIVDAINANVPGSLEPIPKSFVFRKQNAEVVSVAFHAAFQASGGVAALAQWAKSNPDKFYPLYIKLLPTDTLTPVGGVNLTFVSAIPTNPLDRVNVDATGKVFTEAEVRDEVPE